MELVLSLLFDEEQKELTSWHTWHVLRMNEYIQAPESGTAHYIREDLRRESEVQRWMVRTDAACFKARLKAQGGQAGPSKTTCTSLILYIVFLRLQKFISQIL